MAEERIGRVSVDVNPDFDQAELFRQIKAVQKRLPDLKIPVKITAGEVNNQIKELNQKKIAALKLPVKISAKDVNAEIKEVNSKKLAPIKIDVKFSRSQIKRALKEAQVGASLSSEIKGSKGAVLKAEDEIFNGRKAAWQKAARMQGKIESDAQFARINTWKNAARIQDNIDRQRVAAIKNRQTELSNQWSMFAKKAIEEDRLRLKSIRDAATRKPVFVQFSSNLDQLAGQLRPLEIGIQRVFRAGTIAAVGFAAAVTAVTVAVTNLSLKSFAQLEESARNAASIFAELELSGRKFGSAQEAQQAALAQGAITTQQAMEAARNTSFKTTESANDVAKGLFFLASAGVRASDAMSQIGNISKFAQAGMFDIEKASELLLQSVNATGVGIGRTKEVMDLLTSANIRSQTTIEDLAVALTNRAGASFRQLHQPLRETIGLLGELGNVGITGQTAGTQLAITVREVARAASGAKDTAKAMPSEEFKALGINVFNAKGEMKDFSQIVDELSIKLGGLSDKELPIQLKLLGLTERSNSTLRSLIVRSAQLRRQGSSLAREVQITANQASGSTARIAEQQLQTLSAQAKIFRNNIAALGQEFAGPLAAGITQFLLRFNKGGGIFKEFAGQARGLGIDLARSVMQMAQSISAADIKGFIVDLSDSFKITLSGIKSFFTEFASQIDGTKQQSRTFLESIGVVAKSFAQLIATVGPAVGKFIGQFTNFIINNKKAIKEVSKIAFTFLIVQKAFRLVIVPLLNLAAAFKLGVLRAGGFEAILGRLATAIKFVGGPISAVAITIGVSLIPKLIKLNSESESFRKSVGGFGGIIKAVALPMMLGLKRSIEGLNKAINVIYEPFDNFFRLLDGGDGIMKAFLKSVALFAVNLVDILGTSMINLIEKIFSPLFNLPKIGKTLEKAFGGVRGKYDDSINGLKKHLLAKSEEIGASVGTGVSKGADKSIKDINTKTDELKKTISNFSIAALEGQKQIVRPRFNFSKSQTQLIARTAVFQGIDPDQVIAETANIVAAARRARNISPVIKTTGDEIQAALEQLGLKTYKGAQFAAEQGAFGAVQSLNEGQRRIALWREGMSKETIGLRQLSPEVEAAIAGTGSATARGAIKANAAAKGAKLSDFVKSVFGGLKDGINSLLGVFKQTEHEKRLASLITQANNVTRALSDAIGPAREYIRKPIRLAVQDINNILATMASRTAAGTNTAALALAAVGNALGIALMKGMMDGIRTYLTPESPLYALLHKEIPDFIRAHKGPIATDRTILVPAGVAIMEGLTTGLRRGFEPVKGYLQKVGPSMEEFVPDSIFSKRVGEYMVDVAMGKKPNPNDFFKEFEQAGPVIGPGGVSDPRLGFMHRTMSLFDTTQMAQSLARTFGLQVSALKYDHSKFTSSGNISDHFKGIAADISNGVLTPQEDALAAALRPLQGSIIKQLIWRNKDQRTGAYIPGHENHVHVAWMMANGFSLLSRKVGSGAGSGGGPHTPWDAIFALASQRYNISESLLKAVAKAESGFRANAGSPAGARGIMQLMPSTFASLGVGGNILDPRQNIFAGAKYLSSLLRSFHSVPLAVAGYNAGGGAVQRYHGIPPFSETMAYVKRVLQFLREFGGFRQFGGPTMGNKPYIVGESGPELHIPRRPGFVMSNDRLDRMLRMMESGASGNGYSPTYNIQTASDDPMVVARMIEARQRRRLARIVL